MGVIDLEIPANPISSTAYVGLGDGRQGGSRRRGWDIGTGSLYRRP